tara:strand:- start:1631 stop:1888 length:258 start_codon:yes stop_codon:yes gene_type:complete
LVREAKKLQLGYRDQAGHGQPNGRSGDHAFGKWRVDHPLFTELLDEPFCGPEYAAIPAYVLTQDHDPLIAGHLVMQGFIDGLEHG